MATQDMYKRISNAIEATLKLHDRIKKVVDERRVALGTLLTLDESELAERQEVLEALLKPIDVGNRLISSSPPAMTPLRPAQGVPPSSVRRDATQSSSSPLPPAPTPIKWSSAPENYISHVSCVVKHPDGTWYELRCPICGGNASPKIGKFLKGTKAFYDHLAQSHQEGRISGGVEAIIARCQVRKFSEEEAEKLQTDAPDAPVVKLRVTVSKRKVSDAEVMDPSTPVIEETPTVADDDEPSSSRRSRRRKTQPKNYYAPFHPELEESDHESTFCSQHYLEDEDGDDDEELPSPKQVKVEVKDEAE